MSGPVSQPRRSLGRRRDDRKWPRHLRDLWMLAITGLVVLALSHAGDALNNVQQGRRVANGVNCAILSAISEAGRQVIGQGASQPETPLTRFLERHGYPPARVRARQAQMAADAYVSSISQRIEMEVGHKGDQLVRPDGTINCDRLASIAAIPHQPAR